MAHRTKNNTGASGGKGMGYLLEALLGATSGGEEANPNFNSIPIGTASGDVDPQAYAGQNMSSYKGMSPTEISNTPYRPRGSYQTAMGNDSNAKNDEYRLKQSLGTNARTSALDLENLRTSNDKSVQELKFKHDDESSAQAAKDKEALSNIEYLQKWSLQNNIDIGELKNPEVKKMLLESLQAKERAGQSKNKMESLQANQKTSALTHNPNLTERYMLADLEGKETKNVMDSYTTLSPGQSRYRTNIRTGLPTFVGASQPYPIEEPIMQTIGGQQFPTGKFNSQMQKTQITIPRNSFLDDGEPTQPKSFGNPYPIQARGNVNAPVAQSQQPTSAMSEEDMIKSLEGEAGMGDINAQIQIQNLRKRIINRPGQGGIQYIGDPNSALAPNIPFYERATRLLQP